MRSLGNDSQGIEEFFDDDGGTLSADHPHVHGFLPGDHPHPRLYHDVTPIWHDGESPERADDRFGEGYTCGFSTGFERGIVMIMMRLEWAVGWYRALRQYYLASNHTPDDMQSWERCAEQTAAAMPVMATTMVTQTPHPPSIVSQSQALATEDLQ